MKKCIYDMIVEYSCNRFGAMKKGYERFTNLLTDEIKQGMDRFKPFTVYVGMPALSTTYSMRALRLGWHAGPKQRQPPLPSLTSP